MSFNNDFDKRFDQTSKEFDRDFKRIKIWRAITTIIGSIISLVLIGFGIWVVIMLGDYPLTVGK